MVGKQLKTALINQIQLKLVNLAEFTASDTERGYRRNRKLRQRKDKNLLTLVSIITFVINHHYCTIDSLSPILMLPLYIIG